MMFANREEAARLLVKQLEVWRGKHPLVLAIPRGAAPMARIIADALDGELDVVLVHKLGAPGNPEFAIGAVDETGAIILGDYAPHGSGLDAYVKAEAERQLATLRQRRALYGGPRSDPTGRIVIVVDDGVATGTTLLAALTALRRFQPTRLIAAVGVAPPTTVARLEAAADEVICLATPDPFYAVSQFFADFTQVSDDEVVAALKSGPSHVPEA